MTWSFQEGVVKGEEDLEENIFKLKNERTGT
jgi:hypothetical protein